MRHSPWRVMCGLVEGNVYIILMCLKWLDEGTKILVSLGNFNMSWGTLVP
jgi:hypothetical protein